MRLSIFKTIFLALSAVMMLGLTGCGSSGSSTDSGFGGEEPTIIVESIQLTFADGTTAKKVPVGVTGTMTALATYSDGKVVDVTDQVSYEVSNSHVVAFANPNFIKSVAEGSATVTAKLDGVVSNAITVNVASATVVLDSIQVTPANLTLPKNAQATYTALGVYSDGSTYDITNDVTFRSNDTTVATMDGNVATAIGAGNTEIIANKDGIEGSTGITVSLATLSSVQLTFADGTTAKK